MQHLRVNFGGIWSLNLVSLSGFFFVFLLMKSGLIFKSPVASSGLPISVIWTFFARCYGWGATSEYRLEIGDFAPTGASWPKFRVEGVVPYQPLFLAEN